jgi:oligosaccharide repeat unit polymerase
MSSDIRPLVKPWILTIVLLVLSFSLLIGIIIGIGFLYKPFIAAISSAMTLAISIVFICGLSYLFEGSLKGENAPIISPVKISFLYYCIFFLTAYVTDYYFVMTGKVPNLIGATPSEWPYSLLCFAIGAASLGISSRLIRIAFICCRKVASAKVILKSRMNLLSRIGTIATLVNIVGISAQVYIFYRIGSITMLNQDVDNLRIQGANLSPLVTLFAFLPVPAFLLSIEYLVRDKGIHKIGAAKNIINAFCALAILFLASARFPVTVALLGGILIVGDAKNRFPRVWVILCSSTLVILILGLGYYRFLVHGTVGHGLPGVIESLVADAFGYGRNFAIVPRIFPSRVPFYNGFTYLRVVIGFIPSIYTNALGIPKDTIWNSGGQFLKLYYGYNFPGGGIGVSALGEGYMNFGMFGIVISSCIYALLMRIIEHLYLIIPRNTFPRIFVNLLFAASFFYLTTELALVFIPVFVMMLPLFLFSNIFRGFWISNIFI